MKARGKFNLLILMLFLVFIGCEKKEEEKKIESEGFKAGEVNSNIRHIRLDSIIIIFASEQQSQEQYELDVNGDGEKDLRIVSNNRFFEGGIKYLEARIDRMNNRVEVAMTEVIDTIRCCTRRDDTNSMTYYNSVSGFVCNFSDNIAGINQNYYPRIFYKNEIIDTTIFRGYNGKMLLCKYDFSSFVEPSISKNDFLLGEWNGVQEQYLILRIKYVDHYHYGWLKLSVSDFNKITFTEFAFQLD